MLVPNADIVILFLVLVEVHFLEYLEKSAVVLLQDGVLCGQIQRPATPAQTSESLVRVCLTQVCLCMALCMKIISPQKVEEARS